MGSDLDVIQSGACSPELEAGLTDDDGFKRHPPFLPAFLKYPIGPLLATADNYHHEQVIGQALLTRLVERRG